MRILRASVIAFALFRQKTRVHHRFRMACQLLVLASCLGLFAACPEPTQPEVEPSNQRLEELETREAARTALIDVALAASLRNLAERVTQLDADPELRSLLREQLSAVEKAVRGEDDAAVQSALQEVSRTLDQLGVGAEDLKAAEIEPPTSLAEVGALVRQGPVPVLQREEHVAPQDLVWAGSCLLGWLACYLQGTDPKTCDEMAELCFGVCGEVSVGAIDPDEFPPPQVCRDTFDQEGKASQNVQSCNNIQAELELRLTRTAIADANRKAGIRCPNKCPTRFLRAVSNRRECNNNRLTVFVTRRYRCELLEMPDKK